MSSLLQWGQRCTIILVIMMRLFLVAGFVFGDNQPTGLSLISQYITTTRFLHDCSGNAGGLLTLGTEEVGRASLEDFLQWRSVPPRNLQNANRDFLPRLCRSGLSCTDRRGMLNALPLLYRSAITIHSGKNVRFVRFYPPPDYYTKGNVLFAVAEAAAAGRRPGNAAESGSAGCLHD